jgi:hypothetical protein
MAKYTNRVPLVKGKNMTGVTDKQVKELDINITPMHPGTELRKHEAIFQANSGFRDFFVTLTVVAGHIYNAQNRYSSWINNLNSKTYLAVEQYLNFNQNISNT